MDGRTDGRTDGHRGGRIRKVNVEREAMLLKCCASGTEELGHNADGREERKVKKRLNAKRQSNWSCFDSAIRPVLYLPSRHLIPFGVQAAKEPVITCIAWQINSNHLQENVREKVRRIMV